MDTGIPTDNSPDVSDPDVTGRLLRAAAARGGVRALPWIAAPLVRAERVLDVCCRAGALASELPGSWLGVDPAPGPGTGPRIAGLPTALPLCDNAVDGAVLSLALPHLPDVDGLFAELRRVLRPSGTLVIVVPAGSPRSFTELRFASVLAPVRRSGWTNRSALDATGWLLAAADFAVLGDDRVPFTLPMPDAAAAHALVSDLPRTGWWPPELPAATRDGLVTALADRAGPGRVLPVPLRRLVARR